MLKSEIVKNMLQELDVTALSEFLYDAKRSTFANDAPRSQSKSILSKNYIYEKNDFKYEDQYFGEIIDVGEEIVWFKEIPVWGMGYRGGIKLDFIEQKIEVFNFLRLALQSPVPSIPIRGPNEFIKGNLCYINNVNGDITSFTGLEYISRNGSEVYSRNYIGGLIYGKYNINMKLR